MTTFNGVSYTFASFAPYAYATIWDQFWTDVLTELDNRAGGMGGAVPAFITGWDAGTVDASPGAGKLRLNAATLAATTQLYISTTDALGGDVSAVIGLFDDSTSTSIKGLLRVGHRSNQSRWALFAVTGAVTAAAGYSKVPVSYIAGPGGFAAGDPLALGFVPKGDAGPVGGASLPAGSAAAPGLAVTGDADTGLAQLQGPNSLSAVTGGRETVLVLMDMHDGYLFVLGGDGRGRLRLRTAAAGTAILENTAAGGALSLRTVSGEVARCVDTAGADRCIVLAASATDPQIGTSAGAVQFVAPVKAKQAVVAYAATIALDFTSGHDFVVDDLTGPLTLANPGTYPVGQRGEILIREDGAGGRTVSFGNAWVKMGNGTINTAANKYSIIVYWIAVSGLVHYSIVGGA